MAKVKRICKQCGKEFEVYISARKNTLGIYCSKECRGLSMRNRRAYTCKQCGKVFESIKARSKKSKPVFCCRACYNNYLNEHNRVKCVCKHCGGIFYEGKSKVDKGWGVFCSRDCYFSHRQTIGFTERICRNCGKTFEIKEHLLSHATCDFCSRNCYYEYRHGENAPGWKGGISFEPYCILFNNEFKNRVRAYFNNTCVLCGKTREECKRNFHIHHVNYDKETCCNDSERLFVPLCPSCHAKTNHNRNYWQEYFTQLINEKYNGKCYYTKEEYDAINSA